MGVAKGLILFSLLLLTIFFVGCTTEDVDEPLPEVPDAAVSNGTHREFLYWVTVAGVRPSWRVVTQGDVLNFSTRQPARLVLPEVGLDRRIPANSSVLIVADWPRGNYTVQCVEGCPANRSTFRIVVG